MMNLFSILAWSELQKDFPRFFSCNGSLDDPANFVAMDGGEVPTAQEIEQHRAAAEASRVVALSPEERLAALNTAYKAAVPEAMRPAFAPAFAIVRVLVEAGEKEQAKAYVASLQVPEELETARQGIVALLT